MKVTQMMLFAVSSFLLLQLSGCGDDETGGTSYDPSKPVELTTFYPDSGYFQEKVILNGSNFGTDLSKIKVYFNKRLAALIGSNGSQLYVQAPRLPGDTCVISVVVGEDSAAYSNTFSYKESITVNTIAGNGKLDSIVVGSLSNSSLHPMYLCVDNDNNIFVVSRIVGDDGSDNAAILRIDEEADELVMISRVWANVPCVDTGTGVVTLPTETTIGSFLSLDPLEFWATRTREMKWPANYQIPEKGYKHCMVVNPIDGYIYTRYYYGDIIKINPNTYEVTPVYKTQTGDSYGLTFNPLHPNILYMTFIGNAGEMSNSICSIDVTDPENTYKRISSSNTSGGFRDGALAKAQFRDPMQLFCDNDGNMYVADRGNHCIRRITPDNMVETVLGIPGTKGWKDGTKSEALFNEPTGIGISRDGTVYVADWGNGRVRKLTIN